MAFWDIFKSDKITAFVSDKQLDQKRALENYNWEKGRQELIQRQQDLMQLKQQNSNKLLMTSTNASSNGGPVVVNTGSGTTGPLSSTGVTNTPYVLQGPTGISVVSGSTAGNTTNPNWQISQPVNIPHNAGEENLFITALPSIDINSAPEHYKFDQLFLAADTNKLYQAKVCSIDQSGNYDMKWVEVKLLPDLTIQEVTAPVEVKEDCKELYDAFEQSLVKIEKIEKPEKVKDDSVKPSIWEKLRFQNTAMPLPEATS